MVQNVAVVPQSQRAAVQDILTQRITGWSQEWFVAQVELSLRFNEVLFAADPHMQGQLYQFAGKGKVQLPDDDTVPQLGAIAMGTRAEEAELKAASNELGQKLLADLQQRLFAQAAPALKPMAASGSNACFGAAVEVQCQLFQQQWCIALDLTALQQLQWVAPVTESHLPLQSIASVLEQRKVRLQAQLNPTAIPLSELLALQVGDILPLEHSLQQPINLQAPGGKLKVNNFLVQNAGRKALILGR